MTSAGSKAKPRYRVVAAFPDADAARRAADALRAAGSPPEDITIAGGAATAATPREREERFIGRLVLIVVVWSIVGTALGVVIGLMLNALEIGPGGRGGLIIQMASWAVFVHLLAGLWAGYALLTKGESREAVRHIEGGRAVVSVWCTSIEPVERVGVTLRKAGGGPIAVYDSEGRLQVQVHLPGE